jgi:hypothetical protein
VVAESPAVTPYAPSDEAEWEALVADAPMATLLHTRRFLGYHGDRFTDASAVLRDERGRLVGVFPAAHEPGLSDVVTSHPGVTFGGIVHDGRLRGAAMLSALAALAAHYRSLGLRRLRYAAVPAIYHQRPSADDLYALFRMNARRYRCDLSCAVELATGPRLSSRRRRALNKARRAGLDIAEGPALADALWPVIAANLARRHDAVPTHSLPEIRRLIDRFPDEIAVVVARHAGEVVAGTVLFLTPTVAHAQYIASTPDGNAIGALDAVFEHGIARARAAGRRIFDFGTSNREAGWVLNDSLYDFKAQFGGGGVAHEFYELDLSTATPNPVSP